MADKIRLRTLAPMALTLSLVGCSASGPLYSPAPVPDGQAAIYVYRPQRGFQMAGHPNVYIDGAMRHALKNGGYGVSLVAPGRHEVKVSGSLLTNWMLRDVQMTLEAGAGQRVFLRYTPLPSGAYVIGGHAGLTGASDLQEVPQSEASTEIAQTRRDE
jgi:predicted small lipoprotein YifL